VLLFLLHLLHHLVDQVALLFFADRLDGTKLLLIMDLAVACPSIVDILSRNVAINVNGARIFSTLMIDWLATSVQGSAGHIDYLGEISFPIALLLI